MVCREFGGGTCLTIIHEALHAAGLGVGVLGDIVGVVLGPCRGGGEVASGAVGATCSISYGAHVEVVAKAIHPSHCVSVVAVM